MDIIINYGNFAGSWVYTYNRWIQCKAESLAIIKKGGRSHNRELTKKMEKQKKDNNKKGILAPLLKTLDYLLSKLGYEENSRVRKKLEPAILVVVIILLGFLPALFTNLINFEIKKFVGTFIGILILLVIGSWIIAAFNIKEKTKQRLGILFIILAILGFLVYILYENRQVIYDLKKEIDIEFKKDKNIDNEKDTVEITSYAGNNKYPKQDNVDKDATKKYQQKTKIIEITNPKWTSTYTKKVKVNGKLISFEFSGTNTLKLEYKSNKDIDKLILIDEYGKTSKEIILTKNDTIYF